MRKPLIITVAGTGAELTRKHTPYVPLTTDEIVTQAKEVAALGACIWHLHVRDAMGKPSCNPSLIRKTAELIRKQTSMIIQVSTGGAVTDSASDRIGTLVPGLDMASLTLGSVNFGDDVFLNPVSLILKLHTKMRKLGIRPEFEIFDGAMMDYATYLIGKKILIPPFHYNFVMGGIGFLNATPSNLDFLIRKLPKKSTFSVSGLGRLQFPLVELALAAGGHVRVGLEDNIYIESGVKARGNAELVERVLSLSRQYQRPIASISQARRLLQL